MEQEDEEEIIISSLSKSKAGRQLSPSAKAMEAKEAMKKSPPCKAKAAATPATAQ